MDKKITILLVLIFLITGCDTGENKIYITPVNDVEESNLALAEISENVEGLQNPEIIETPEYPVTPAVSIKEKLSGKVLFVDTISNEIGYVTFPQGDEVSLFQKEYEHEGIYDLFFINDGHRVLVNSDFGIEIYDIDAGLLHSVDIKGLVADGLALSRDGNELVFVGAEDFGVDYDQDLYILDLNTDAVTKITDDKIFKDHPVWSPDGTKIAFISRMGFISRHLEMISKDGSNRQVLTSRDVQEYYGLSWAPNGEYIAFTTLTSDLLSSIGEFDFGGQEIEVIPVPKGMNLCDYPVYSGNNDLLFTCLKSQRLNDPDSTISLYIFKKESHEVEQVYTFEQRGNNLPLLFSAPTKEKDLMFVFYYDRVRLHKYEIYMFDLTDYSKVLVAESHAIHENMFWIEEVTIP